MNFSTTGPDSSSGAGECPDQATMRAFLLGRASEAESDALENHFDACTACQAQLAVADAEDNLVRDARSGSARIDRPLIEAANRLARQTLESSASETGPYFPAIDWLEPAERSGDLGRLGPYHVVSIVGRGGMGVVFRAEDTRLPRTVALKVLLEQRCLSPEYRQRFFVEAALMARLQHPGIVQVFETGEHRGRPYLALEFVPGGTLAARLGDRRMPPDAAAALIARLSRAVQAAHALGVVHRDLKPANILLAIEDGELTAKITDFGLARDLAAPAGTFTGDVLGTPGYMAPELIGARGHGPAVDIYSLGAIFFELLTGRAPFCGVTPFETLRQSQLEEPVSPRQIDRAIPRDLESIALKCLSKDPGRRYVSAAELADDLDRFGRGEPIRARPATALERVVKWIRRRPAAAALIGVSTAAVLALVIGGGVYQWQLRTALADAEANAQRADANYRSARDALLTTLDAGARAADSGVPQVRELHYRQAQAAVAFFQAAVNVAGSNDVQTRHELAQVTSKLGVAATNLGKRDEAIERFAATVALLDDLLADDAHRADLRFDRAHARGMAGFNHLFAGRSNEALPNLTSAISELTELHFRDDRQANVDKFLAKFSHDLGTTYRRLNRLDEAAASFRRAVEVHNERLVGVDRTAADETMLSDSYISLGLVAWQTKDFDQADDVYRKAEARLMAARAKTPNSPDAAAALGALFINWGLVEQDRQQPENALARFTQAIDVLTAAHDREPKYVRLWMPLRNALGARSTLLEKLERWPQAIADVERGLPLVDAVQQFQWRSRAIEFRVRQGDLDEAGAAMLRAKSADPAGWPQLRKLLIEDDRFAALRSWPGFAAAIDPK